MSSQIRYYDMPGNIKIKNGIVHIDMYDEAPDPKAPQNDNPNFVFSERLAMSLPAFVEMYKLMSQAVDNLAEQGVLTREDKDEDQGTVQIATEPQAGQETVSAVTADDADDAAVAAATKAAPARRNSTTSRRKKNKRR